MDSCSLTWGTIAGKVHSSIGCVCPSVTVVISENLKAYNLKVKNKWGVKVSEIKWGE